LPSRNKWQFKKEINLSMVIQLCLMASLVIGSWLNLERRIDALQHDVETLLKGQDRFSGKVEELSAVTVRHEYRLEVIERTMKKEDRL
jgi:uncharacterized membrane protein YqgA involved in biofilm formation